MVRRLLGDSYLLAVLIVAVVVASVLVVVGALVADESFDLGSELAKTGLQLGAVTLVGGVITALLKRREDQRADEQRKEEYRARLFTELVRAYNGVKLERRALRAQGFREGRGTRELTAEDAAQFSAQLRSLTYNALLVEGVAREVKAHREWFTNAPELLTELKTLEDYFNALIEEWEDTDGEIVAGTPRSRIDGLTDLQALLAGAGRSFGESAAVPMRRIEALLRAEVFLGAEVPDEAPSEP